MLMAEPLWPAEMPDTIAIFFFDRLLLLSLSVELFIDTLSLAE